MKSEKDRIKIIGEAFFLEGKKTEIKIIKQRDGGYVFDCLETSPKCKKCGISKTKSVYMRFFLDKNKIKKIIEFWGKLDKQKEKG